MSKLTRPLTLPEERDFIRLALKDNGVFVATVGEKPVVRTDAFFSTSSNFYFPAPATTPCFTVSYELGMPLAWSFKNEQIMLAAVMQTGQFPLQAVEQAYEQVLDPLDAHVSALGLQYFLEEVLAQFPDKTTKDELVHPPTLAAINAWLHEQRRPWREASK